jgi:transcriptional regulator with XRE-family HTH domain
MILASVEEVTMRRSLTELREEHDLSVVELAEKVGVSDQSIRLWEAGEVRPRPQVLIRLCAVLQISENEIDLQPYTNEGKVLEDRRKAGRMRWEKHRAVRTA